MRANDKNTTDLNALYKTILEAAGAHVDERGFVSNRTFGSDELTPMVVDGERLVLPTMEQLKTARKGVSVTFHPLFEHANHGESKVLAALRKMMSVRLSFTLTSVVSSLLMLAASTAEHKKLSPDQSEFLSVVGELGKDTLGVWAKYVENLAKKNQLTHMVDIYLKRGGVLNKQAYNRTSIVTFQAYNELASAETKTAINGVKFTAKDRAAIVNLFQYVLPLIATKDAYSAGSLSSVAPFIAALMKSYEQVASRLNDVIRLFQKHIQDADQLLIDTSWVEAFDDLGQWQSAIHLIPPQPGNEGAPRNPNAARAPTAEPTIDTSAQVVNTHSPEPLAQHHRPATVPVEEPAPAPVPGRSYFDSLPTLTPQQIAAQQAPIYQPQGSVPIYQQPQEPLVNENGAVNFRAALAASGLAGAAGNTVMPGELISRQMQLTQQPGSLSYQPQGNPYFQQPQPRATYSGGVAQQNNQNIPGLTTSF